MFLLNFSNSHFMFFPSARLSMVTSPLTSFVPVPYVSIQLPRLFYSTLIMSTSLKLSVLPWFWLLDDDGSLSVGLLAASPFSCNPFCTSCQSDLQNYGFDHINVLLKLSVTTRCL